MKVAGCRIVKTESVRLITSPISLQWSPYVAAYRNTYSIDNWHRWFDQNRPIASSGHSAVVQNHTFQLHMVSLTESYGMKLRARFYAQLWSCTEFESFPGTPHQYLTSWTFRHGHGSTCRQCTLQRLYLDHQASV